MEGENKGGLEKGKNNVHVRHIQVVRKGRGMGGWG